MVHLNPLNHSMLSMLMVTEHRVYRRYCDEIQESSMYARSCSNLLGCECYGGFVSLSLSTSLPLFGSWAAEIEVNFKMSCEYLS